MNLNRMARLLSATLLCCAFAHAAEHVTLRNGFELDCQRQEPAGDRIRLYLMPPADGGISAGPPNYMEVPASQILRSESIPELPPAPAPPLGPPRAPTPRPPIPQMLASAGTQHNIDADLLASVIHAESGGEVHAVSRAGAQGLMQLMPSTAARLGVSDTFAPEQNIGGGTTYLDQLLTRYHNDLALALAAYNAGPAAVDRYHGIPPYAETRAYVARVIREFNRRKLAATQSPASLQPNVR